MPQIPDFESVGVATPRPAPPPRMSGDSPVADAMVEAGQVIGQIAEKQYKRATTLAEAAAESENLRGLADLKQQVIADPDYGSWQTKFEAGAAKVNQTAASNIRDRSAQALFAQNAAQRSIAVGSEIATAARERDREMKRAGIIQTRDANVQTAIDSPDSALAQDVVNNTNDLLKSGAASGVISGAESGNWGREAVQRIAEGRLLKLDPASRIKALEQGMTRDESGQATFTKTNSIYDLLPSDTKLKLLDAARIDQRQDYVLQRQQREDVQRQEGDKILQGIYAGTVNATAIVKNNVLDPTGENGKERYLQILDHHLHGEGGEMKTNPTLYTSLWDRAHLDDGDPRKLVDENEVNRLVGRGLSVPSALQLRAEIQGKRSEEGSIEATLKKSLVDAAKSSITGTDPLMHLRDPKGDVQMLQWMNQFLPAWEKARKSGISATDLTDEKNPAYLGRTIQRYTRSRAEMMRDLFQSNNMIVPGATAPDTLPQPSSPAEAAKLPPGTRYRLPDGNVMVR